MTTAQSNNQYFSPSEMMAEAEKFALSKASKSSGMTLSLAILAGAFIGLAFLFYITVTTGNASAGWGLSRLAGGLAFSLGLILIVLCGGELFTSSVLSSITWANKQISFRKMLSIWGKVYLGNFIGAMFLLCIVFAAGLYQMDHGQWGLNALNIAQHKLHHTPVQAFSLGVLCNLLVCLAIWLTFSSANAMTKAMMTILPVAMFVSSGFEHCVANMFMVPLGIAIQSFAPQDFWQQIGVASSVYADINVQQFLFANLIPVTAGNIVGGAVLVGLANWGIYRRPQLKSVNVAPINSATPIKITSDTAINSDITAASIMNPCPLTLKADMTTAFAIDTLLTNQQSSACVCDNHHHLIGFFSAHDVMVDLWCQDYQPKKEQTVAEIMTEEVVAINVDDTLLDIAEYLSIDKDQIYPVNDLAISTHYTSLSLHERAKAAKVTKPHMLPVLNEGLLVGVITREALLAALRPMYGKQIAIVDELALESA